MKKFVTRIFAIIISLCSLNCSSTKSSSSINEKIILSEITANSTSLNNKDVMVFYCSSLTEYFNRYKYYKIDSEVYSEKEKQEFRSSARIFKQGNIFIVEYLGSGGKYMILFSNKQFSESEQIFTFVRKTVLGNAIRGKIYDTFSAWLKRVEIALKANNNLYLYREEVIGAVELENWYNSLN